MSKEKILMYELENLEDFQIEIPGLRKFECIGGSKNFQVFLAPKEWSRTEFMNNYKDYLDDCVKPIYEDDDLVVSQDVRYAVPGFYILSTKTKQRTILDLNLKLYQKCMKFSFYIGDIIKEITGENCFYYYEEHLNKPASTHFWVLPVYSEIVKEKDFDLTICKQDIWEYIDYFRFTKVKTQINNLNKFMRKKLKEISDEIR